MAEASCRLSEVQFLCPICLDVFTDPVTTSCGHNFCKNCITVNWNVNDQYRCPMCKNVFDTRPELHVNTFISEMVAQFRQSLIDPVENLEDRMCTKHNKPLELFCKTDQACVCMLCTVSDHKMHDVVPLKEEYEEKKAELEAEIQQMIQKRRLKIQEIKHSVDLSEDDADIEIAVGVQVFTFLMESVERGLNELINTIKEKQKTTEKQAEAFIKELEQEISELMKRSTEVEQLSHSEDHLHLLQSVHKDVKKFSLNPCVLGKQSFSSGSFYFEVQVKGKTEWDLGVARESVNRKGDIPLSPEDGYWTIWLRKKMKYKALADPPVLLSLKSRPQKVGVFVDYEEGLVSFYDVDAAALIYSFTGCSFTEKLFPYFNPGLNDGGKNSLIITLVNPTE
uniref:E3 ubiquitin-protein ligase TRIM21-like n=1 Tax=Sander lucioperca TaxID=283035 RepID=A0A8D0CVF7_SANLU